MKFSILLPTTFALAVLAVAWSARGPADAQSQNSPGRVLDSPELSSGKMAPPTYKPPLRGAPGGRTGGGSRGINNRSLDQSLALSVLAPNHTALTVQEQPMLYWFVSGPLAIPVEVTVSDAGPDPVVEKVLNPPFEGGVQKLSLADLGVHLMPGKQYQWYVTVVPDPKRRSLDVLAGATIERTDLPPTVTAQLVQDNKLEAARAYAEAGHWYDALASLSDLIEANPHDAVVRSYRAALLRQVGLPEIAEFDLRQERRQ